MLRTERTHRLDWRDIRLDERVVVVGAKPARGRKLLQEIRQRITRKP